MRKVNLRYDIFATASLLIAVLSSNPCSGQVNVTTWHNDNWRTGQNTNESAFSTGSGQLNKNNFGRLCQIPLSSIQGQTRTPWSYQVYAQPLVVADSTGGGMKVYVVTQGDYLYRLTVPAGFNASGCNSLITSAQAVDLLAAYQQSPKEYPVDCCFIGGGGCQTIAPTVGILGTPVIDTATNTLYLVAESQQGPQSGYHPGNCNQSVIPQGWIHRLHALDLTSSTLADKFNGPAQIQGASGFQTFASREIIQRPGLLGLPAGLTPAVATVYAAFSMMDGYTSNPPSGWVFGYKANDLSVTPSVFAIAQGQNAQGGGVWQGGAGLAAGKDGGSSPYLFLSTADGDFGANSSNYADSFVKLPPGLSGVSGSFTPTDQFFRKCNDLDFGSGGTVLLPDNLLASPNSPYLAVKADKENYLWVFDRSNLSGFTPGNCYQGPNCSSATQCANQSSLVQSFQFATQYEGHSSPAFWYGHSSGSSGSLYFAPTNGKLNKYAVSASCPTGQGGPVCTTPITSSVSNVGYLTTPSISSSPYDSQTQTYPNGIAWVVASDGSAQSTNPAVLYAFDASSSPNLNELYDSNMCSGLDTPGNATRYSVPTIANGYVIIGTQTDVDIYGTLTRTCN